VCRGGVGTGREQSEPVASVSQNGAAGTECVWLVASWRQVVGGRDDSLRVEPAKTVLLTTPSFVRLSPNYPDRREYPSRS
jgi:hypothetical protein